MLAQNFLDAQTLKITEPQRKALILTLDYLERGELEYISYEDCFIRDFSRYHVKPPSGFNMAHWFANTSCGTIACIGGIAELVGKVRFHDALPGLFCPYSVDVAYNEITVEQAAQALRNFLTTGRPEWWTVLHG